MNLLVHHLRKDARHLRGLLIAWALLVLAQGVLIGWGNRAEPDNSAALVAFEIVATLLPVLQGLLTIVLIPLLVHDEPQVGTTGFWLTRPLPRSTLLSSKLLSVLAVVVLFPWMVDLVVMAANKVPLADLVLISPEILVSSLGFALAAMAVAALTPSFARYALTGVGLYAGFLLIALAVFLTRLFLHGTDSFLEEEWGLEQSRAVVTTIWMVPFCGVVVVCQYLTRVTRRSVLIGGGGLLVMLLLGWFWPWDFLSLPAAPPPASMVKCEELGLTTGSRHISTSMRNQQKREPTKTISLMLEVTGQPATVYAYVGKVVGTYTTSSGDIITSTNQSHAFNFSTRWDGRIIEALYPDLRVVGNSSHRQTYQQILEVPLSQFEKLKDVTGRLSGEVTVNLHEAVEEFAIPLARAARFDRGAEHVEIGAIEKTPRGCVVQLRCTELNREWKRQAQGQLPQRLSGRQHLYLLRNPVAGEIAFPDDDQNFSFSGIGAERRLVVQPLHLAFPNDRDLDGDVRVLDEAWMKDAELVRVGLRPMGTCTVMLDVPEFELRDESSTSRTIRQMSSDVDQREDDSADTNHLHQAGE